MRTEALEKEAELYTGNDQCYVHAEQIRNGPLSMITNGDPNALAKVLYSLTIEIAHELNKSPVDIWKFLIRVYKKHGEPESIKYD